MALPIKRVAFLLACGMETTCNQSCSSGPGYKPGSCSLSRHPAPQAAHMHTCLKEKKMKSSPVAARCKNESISLKSPKRAEFGMAYSSSECIIPTQPVRRTRRYGRGHHLRESLSHLKCIRVNYLMTASDLLTFSP